MIRRELYSIIWYLTKLLLVVTTILVYFENNSEELSEISTRYRSGFILHQDNAPVHVHVSRVAKRTMSDLNIEPLQHPPYSPDLAICDFFLFPTVKDHLRERKFESREELGTAITEALRTVTRDGLQHVFRTWVERWDMCIKAKGSYFEKE